MIVVFVVVFIPRKIRAVASDETPSAGNRSGAAGLSSEGRRSPAAAAVAAAAAAAVRVGHPFLVVNGRKLSASNGWICSDWKASIDGDGVRVTRCSGVR